MLADAASGRPHGARQHGADGTAAGVDKALGTPAPLWRRVEYPRRIYATSGPHDAPQLGADGGAAVEKASSPRAPQWGAELSLMQLHSAGQPSRIGPSGTRSLQGEGQRAWGRPSEEMWAWGYPSEVPPR